MIHDFLDKNHKLKYFCENFCVCFADAKLSSRFFGGASANKKEFLTQMHWEAFSWKVFYMYVHICLHRDKVFVISLFTFAASLCFYTIVMMSQINFRINFFNCSIDLCLLRAECSVEGGTVVCTHMCRHN